MLTADVFGRAAEPALARPRECAGLREAEQERNIGHRCLGVDRC